MAGTVLQVNQALTRPLLLAGAEKRLVLLNAMLAMIVIAAAHWQWPQSAIGIVLFIILHSLLVLLAKIDPDFSLICRRASRYYWRSEFLACGWVC